MDRGLPLSRCAQQTLAIEIHSSTIVEDATVSPRQCADDAADQPAPTKETEDINETAI